MNWDIRVSWFQQSLPLKKKQWDGGKGGVSTDEIKYSNMSPGRQNLGIIMWENYFIKI